MKQADQAKELARLSSDCSFLLTHLIRKKEHGNDPSEILSSILFGNKPRKKGELIGSIVGWYGECKAKIYQPYTKNQFCEPTDKRGICFTESTLAGLKAHRKVFKAKHGLAFDREFLFKNKANPCLNIQKSLLKKTVTKDKNYSGYKSVYNFIPNEIAGFVNIIHDSFDSTHEREWRMLGDFEFKYSDIKFIFCPQDEFKIFSKIQTDGIPVLFDLMWLDRI